MAAISQQAEFEADGQRYMVALSVNALCQLEDNFGGRSITEVGEDIASGRLGARGVRALFCAALNENHPDITERQAGKLIDGLGADAASDVIMAAFGRAKAGLEEDVAEMPAPDLKGRLAFDVAGERIVLVFGMNAQAELEEYFDGLTPEEISRKLMRKEVSMRDLRAMFRAAFLDDRELSAEEAGAIIDRIGIRVAGRAVAAAFLAAFPQVAAESEDEPEGNRRQRRAAARRHPTKSPRKDGIG